MHVGNIFVILLTMMSQECKNQNIRFGCSFLLISTNFPFSFQFIQQHHQNPLLPLLTLKKELFSKHCLIIVQHSQDILHLTSIFIQFVCFFFLQFSIYQQYHKKPIFHTLDTKRNNLVNC